MAGLRQDEIRDKVQAYFKAQLAQYVDWLNRRALSQNALADAREEMLDHNELVKLESDHPQHLPVQRFKRKMDISDEDWAGSLPRIAVELRKGRRDMLLRVLEAAKSLEHYSYDNTPDKSSAPSLPSSAPLGQAIADFMAEHSPMWPEKTKRQIAAYFNILIEHFGADRLLGDISKQDASEVKKILQSLPARRNIKPALKNMSLAEVVQTQGYKIISPKTINSHIDTFRRFFDWAERHGHGPHKLFVEMHVPKTRDPQAERKPFTNDQTSLILHELKSNESNLVRRESHKWSALLGLFTGARLNEICQLEIADVQEMDGIWHLDITDEGDNNKRIKAKASRRRVPLHSELIGLGFLKFVESRSGNKRLFPDYSYNTDSGYGRNFGRWFNESFLPKLGINEPALVFHSLRHTMVTRLGQAGVAEPIYQCLVGHAREGVTQEVYLREGYTLLQLQEAIESFGSNGPRTLEKISPCLPNAERSCT